MKYSYYYSYGYIIFFKSFPGCGGHFKAPYGIITSKNYPQIYGPNEDCIWLIEVGTSHLINLTFVDFDVEATRDNRTTDYVNVSIKWYTL